MKIFENKKVLKKIAIMLLMILFFQFGLATPVQAADDDDGVGGVLLSPIVSLIVALGDRSKYNLA